MNLTKTKADKEIQRYIGQIKDIYDHFLAFIDNPDVIAEDDYNNLIQNINKHGIEKNNKELFSHFIRLLVSISNNHHRQTGFFCKIERILHKYQDILKEYNANIEIYEQFESNKRLLYFLIKEKMLIIDSQIELMIENKIEVNGVKYSDFFIPEIKKNDNNKDENITYYMNNLDEYEAKRQIGENDSYICSLIREDSIEKFIEYINRNLISYSSKIKPSIFETNEFLNSKEPTLIEYAAFFGSIQIFQYLYLNKVEDNGSLWIYGIHSNNPDFLRNYIESNSIKPFNQTYKEELKESIKCHHNSIGRYIEDNKNNEEQTILDERIYDIILKYHNYSFFPEEFNQKYEFFYLCKYNYQYIVDCLIESHKDCIESKIIFKKKFCLYN